MPRRPAPLPARLRDQAFLATQPDIARHRVRAGDLWTPTRGTRLPVHRIDVESQCRAHLLTLPAGAAFSHETAAALWGLPGPRRADPPMHITTPAGVRAPRRHSVIGHQAALGTHEVRWLRGLPVTSPARTFLDLATVRDVVDLVAAGDRIISRRAPLSSWEDLADAARRSPGTRGIRTARAALSRLDAGAESPKESELRLLLTDHGFGPWQANAVIRDAAGLFIARVDLAHAEHRVAVEYEGDHHRDRDQWRRDVARRRRLEAVGCTYIPVTQADLDRPAALLADLAGALRMT